MFLQRPQEIKYKPYRRHRLIGVRLFIIGNGQNHQDLTCIKRSPLRLLTSKSSRWRSTAGRSSCASKLGKRFPLAHEAQESSSQTTPQQDSK